MSSARPRCLLCLWLALASSLAAAHASAEGGHQGRLFIIGGGERPAQMMARLAEMAGGASARIAVIPNASSVPLEVGPEQAAELEAAGAGVAFPLVFDREGADSDAVLAGLEGVTGIFFSGGDQRRLTRDLLGTRLLERIRGLYAAGGLVAGTSAGAAVMSPLMITGDERHNTDEDDSFVSIVRDNVVTTEGFGLLAGTIVDQHFIARKRHNRLISLVLESPELLGIGIDESTAIVVEPDGTFEVAGVGQVVVYDAGAAQRISADADGRLSAEAMAVHLLRSGQRFDLASRSVLP